MAIIVADAATTTATAPVGRARRPTADRAIESRDEIHRHQHHGREHELGIEQRMHGERRRAIRR